MARHVLLADDGSKAAAPARRFALMLTAATGARLTAVYVRDPLESREEGHRKLAVTLAVIDQDVPAYRDRRRRATVILCTSSGPS